MRYLLIAILAATTSCTTTLQIERSPVHEDEAALVLRVGRLEKAMHGVTLYLHEQAQINQGASYE